MRRMTLVVLCLISALLLIGCAKTETTNNNNSMSNSSEKPATTTTTSKTETASTSGDRIGVPECDDFIAKYDECVSNKVPEMARAQYKSAVAQWRASWKKMAEDPNTKPTLAAACKQAAQQQAAALKAYGCAF